MIIYSMTQSPRVFTFLPGTPSLSFGTQTMKNYKPSILQSAIPKLLLNAMNGFVPKLSKELELMHVGPKNPKSLLRKTDLIEPQDPPQTHKSINQTMNNPFQWKILSKLEDLLRT